MLQKTDVYLQRLVALRDEGFPLAEQMEREGRLEFDVYVSEDECGTVGCLLGWWATTDYARADGWICGNPPIWEGAPAGAGWSDMAYFGLAPNEFFRLFGLAHNGTLADRRAYLERLISERMGVTA